MNDHNLQSTEIPATDLTPNEFVTPAWLYHNVYWNRNEVGILLWRSNTLSFITCAGKVIFSLPISQITKVKSSYTTLSVHTSGKAFKFAFYSVDGKAFTGPPSQIVLSDKVSGNYMAGLTAVIGGQAAGQLFGGGAQAISAVGLFYVANVFDKADQIALKWVELLRNHVPTKSSRRIMKLKTFYIILALILLMVVIYFLITDWINKTGFFAP